MIDSAVEFTKSIQTSVKTGKIAVSSTDLTSMVGTFNMVSAEHNENCRADLAEGN